MADASAAWISRLSLSDFRNYESLRLDLERQPVVLTGLNGAGKTNLLEAVSLLAPGQGLRRAPYSDLARLGGAGGWSVAAQIETANGPVRVGTGLQPTDVRSGSGRSVRIDNAPARGSGALADYLEVVWLTPAMDGLFTGPASDRRRFLDRLVLCVDARFRVAASQFERAMRQRNRLLGDPGSGALQFDGIEAQMADHAVSIARARRSTVERIAVAIAARRDRSATSPFAWAGLRLEGEMQVILDETTEDDPASTYRNRLRAMRNRDREAGRTLVGPHRTDLIVSHGPKSTLARTCSTGEQKALLINLVLAHAELVKSAGRSGPPILLLDEIAAHLDPERREALFEDLLGLGTQAWMTGTDRASFDAFGTRAQFIRIDASGTA